MRRAGNESREERVTCKALGVPLHADYFSALNLDGLDDAVTRPRGDANALTELIDGLVVKRIHERAVTVDVVERAVGIDCDLLHLLGSWLITVKVRELVL